MSDTESTVSAPIQVPGATIPRVIKRRAPNKRTAPKRTARDAATQGRAAVDHGDERAAPTREQEPEERLTRVSREARQTGTFDIPHRHRKPGRDYEWKVITVYAEPVDSSVITEAHEGGWRPERSGDWPGLMPPGTPATATIDRLGQRLYGRPMTLTMEARDEDYRAAEQQKRDRIQGALSGRPSGVEGLSDIKGIRPVGQSIVVEGEVGVHAGAGRR